ncbi:MAG TPA: hypothetical protein VIY48_08980 [Candidatus Paceibacterota bacterium]
MEVLKDYESRYYLRIEGHLITRTPKVEFVHGRFHSKAASIQPAEDDALHVAAAFLQSAEELGGDSLAIYLIKEAVMAKTSILIINVATHTIVAKKLFEVEVKPALEANPGTQAFASADEFNKLSVAQRCAIARPYLNDKEKDNTPDGEGFAAQAWKIANRFTNPKPPKAEKTPAAGKEKKEAAPRAPGVKTKIADLFTKGDGPDTLHLSVDEIMAKVEGTKSSVVTAISDLRSAKYCGKGGVVNLTLVGGKYALAGGKAEAKAKEAQVAIDKEEADKKAAAKKAKEDAAAKAKAEKDAKAEQKKAEAAKTEQKAA